MPDFFQENLLGKKSPLYPMDFLENKHFSKCDFDDQQERKKERNLFSFKFLSPDLT